MKKAIWNQDRQDFDYFDNEKTIQSDQEETTKITNRQYGWICPKCNNVNAPWARECQSPYCNVNDCKYFI